MRKYLGHSFHLVNRDIHKSVRMDDRIYEYVMRQDGKNFSDKLENLVLDYARLTGHLDIFR